MDHKFQVKKQKYFNDKVDKRRKNQKNNQN